MWARVTDLVLVSRARPVPVLTILEPIARHLQMEFGHVLPMEKHLARVEMGTALRYGSSPHALMFIIR